MTANLRQQWFSLTDNYTNNRPLQEKYWQELQEHYTESHRHYHNLQHIAALLQLATDYSEQLAKMDILTFSIWYHDSIYNPLRKDNEQQSATLAVARLEQIGLSAIAIEQCYQQILATQQHQPQEDEDTNFLLDFDLSILAADWPDYEIYTRQIQKEYWMYPNFMYKKGRRKVLQHFLSMENIYKTAAFKSQHEQKARINMERELQQLA